MRTWLIRAAALLVPSLIAAGCSLTQRGDDAGPSAEQAAALEETARRLRANLEARGYELGAGHVQLFRIEDCRYAHRVDRPLPRQHPDGALHHRRRSTLARRVRGRAPPRRVRPSAGGDLGDLPSRRARGDRRPRASPAACRLLRAADLRLLARGQPGSVGSDLPAAPGAADAGDRLQQGSESLACAHLRDLRRRDQRRRHRTAIRRCLRSGPRPRDHPGRGDGAGDRRGAGAVRPAFSGSDRHRAGVVGGRPDRPRGRGGRFHHPHALRGAEGPAGRRAMAHRAPAHRPPHPGHESRAADRAVSESRLRRARRQGREVAAG